LSSLTALVSRVRTELGDTGRSFVDSFLGDGTTTRFPRPYAPLNGLSVIVKVDGSDVSTYVTAEEAEGILVFDNAPASGASIVTAGTHYRYFTDLELQIIVNEAFAQHTFNRTDAFGRAITLGNLGAVEEYPLALLATINALWTLATDASFDIDILAPDGVTIPRSQRFRQLTELINERRAQYQQLCSALNIGLDRMEVFTLRRKSHRTNRYVPIYRPQEVDDASMPERVFLPMPTYGGTPAPSVVAEYDITLVKGNSFTLPLLDFSFDATNYTAKAQIRTYQGSPVALATFAITTIDAAAATYSLSLTPDQTRPLPVKSFWDMEFTSKTDPTDVKTYVGGVVFAGPSYTTTYGDPIGNGNGIPNPPLLWGSADTGFTQTPPPGAGGFL
jgi:hypothetical protein